jgi:LysM repeat protein
MSALVKARLAEIGSGERPTETPNTSVDVQFNPTTLRVQISNRTAGGTQAGAQARQRPGTGEMQVSFDLIFDTADEGTSEAGVSVLDRTATVERFVRPRGPRPGQEAPPRVLFEWGSFLVQGTMESANIDLDLFDANGVPLRAKVSVSIKGQDPRWTYTPAPANAAAAPGSSPARPGSGSALPAGSPGTQGNSQSPERIAQAMPGESLAQLAARNGFDPKAWRALAEGLSNPLQLTLGQEVPLPAGAGRGVAGGSNGQGADPAQAAASLPLVAAPDKPAGGSQALAPGSAGGSDPVRQGQALASQGGLGGAIAQIRNEAHRQGAGSSLAAFGLTSAEVADSTDRPWGAGVPLRPRFGSARPAARRDPTQPGWATAAKSPASGTAPVATASIARGTASGDCGCRGRRARRNP